MHNDEEPSTSRRPKPSWCKHPSRSSETDSNEYEWDTLSEGASIIDMEIDVIHSFSSQPNVADESSVRTDESNPHIALADHASASMTTVDPDSSEVDLIDSTFLVTRDESHSIKNLEPTTSLSLTHPDLIDWSLQDQQPTLPSFQNDYEIACYLNAIEPITSSTNEPATNMTEADIKYLSHKIKRKNKRSNGENHIVVVSEPKKVKNKDVSKGENLPEVPEDEILGSLPSYFQDRSSVLIEPT